MPEVASKLRVPSFQFIVTVQSEWFETVVRVVLKPLTPTTTGSWSSITPHGI